ncbi:MAG: phytanoyl-CoA dioxygenase family protein [Calothrix sp. SM1_7_51]|nr:phytanoyl-CoA dioxygenase family protein [Calothrix sp. SM1_7_51]
MKVINQFLTEEQLALLPTEEDIAFYEKHGWYASKKVIPSEIIDQAVFGSERFYRGERDAKLPGEKGYTDWKPEDGNGIRNNEYVSLQNQEFAKLCFQPIISAIAASLARTKQIRLFADSLLCKPPIDEASNNNAIGWHTDKAFWSTCSSDNLLTAWIPFQDCDESMGPLVFIDGSHKWSDSQNIKFFYNQNLDNVEDTFRSSKREIVKVPMTLKKGQISFHHCRLVHGSYPNKSQSLRLAMAIHMQDENNHYRPIWNNKGEPIHIGYDLLCRKLSNGNPDYSDPTIFPILWS